MDKHTIDLMTEVIGQQRARLINQSGWFNVTWQEANKIINDN